eukprot:GHVQ01013373.1.p1 GENE.GHVQ01013373.1~~GHVQ01013373.1.p1  ORF type:complete len:920 (+),score=73.48 GHVQ01013373.1:236-2995(+)
MSYTPGRRLSPGPPSATSWRAIRDAEPPTVPPGITRNTISQQPSSLTTSYSPRSNLQPTAQVLSPLTQTHQSPQIPQLFTSPRASAALLQPAPVTGLHRASAESIRLEQPLANVRSPQEFNSPYAAPPPVFVRPASPAPPPPPPLTPPARNLMNNQHTLATAPRLYDPFRSNATAGPRYTTATGIGPSPSLLLTALNTQPRSKSSAQLPILHQGLATPSPPPPPPVHAFRVSSAAETEPVSPQHGGHALANVPVHQLASAVSATADPNPISGTAAPHPPCSAQVCKGSERELANRPTIIPTIIDNNVQEITCKPTVAGAENAGAQTHGFPLIPSIVLPLSPRSISSKSIQLSPISRTPVGAPSTPRASAGPALPCCSPPPTGRLDSVRPPPKAPVVNSKPSWHGDVSSRQTSPPPSQRNQFGRLQPSARPPLFQLRPSNVFSLPKSPSSRLLVSPLLPSAVPFQQYTHVNPRQPAESSRQPAETACIECLLSLSGCVPLVRIACLKGVVPLVALMLKHSEYCWWVFQCFKVLHICADVFRESKFTQFACGDSLYPTEGSRQQSSHGPSSIQCDKLVVSHHGASHIIDIVPPRTPLPSPRRELSSSDKTTMLVGKTCRHRGNSSAAREYNQVATSYVVASLLFTYDSKQSPHVPLPKPKIPFCCPDTETLLRGTAEDAIGECNPWTFRDSLYTSDALSALLGCLQNFKAVLPLQLVGLKVLESLLTVDDRNWKGEIVKYGGIEFLCDVFRSHRNDRIMTSHLLSCLCSLTTVDYIDILAQRQNVIDHVLYSLCVFSEIEEIVTLGLAALSNLTVCEGHVNEIMAREVGIAPLFVISKQYERESNVQMLVLSVFTNYSVNSTARARLSDSGIFETVIQAMQIDPFNKPLQVCYEHVIQPAYMCNLFADSVHEVRSNVLPRR